MSHICCVLIMKCLPKLKYHSYYPVSKQSVNEFIAEWATRYGTWLKEVALGTCHEGYLVPNLFFSLPLDFSASQPPWHMAYLCHITPSQWSHVTTAWSLWNYELKYTFLPLFCVHQLFCPCKGEMTIMSFYNFKITQTCLKAEEKRIVKWAVYYESTFT